MGIGGGATTTRILTVFEEVPETRLETLPAASLAQAEMMTTVGCPSTSVVVKV